MSALENACPLCKSSIGDPCRIKHGRTKVHQSRLGFAISASRIKQLRAEKESLEDMVGLGSQNIADDLWTVNEALRFAVKETVDGRKD